MITIIMVLLVCSGVAKSVKDTLQHHYLGSVFSRLNPLFWDASKSWLNKYKADVYPLQPKFFGSTTFFVFVTDAWHFFDTIQSTCWQVSLSLLLCSYFGLEWYWFLAFLLGVKILVSVPFEITYRALFVKEK